MIAASVVLGGALGLLGYGNDIDVANVLRSGRDWLDDGIYRPSRPPGAPVHELGTAVLDRLGGSVAVTLGSVGFGALAAWCVADLVGGRRGTRALSAAVLVANPWFVIAASSLNDATWAIGLALAGASASARDRRALAGLLFGLAVGCRSSTSVLVLAWVLAERLGARRSRPSGRASLLTLLTGVVVALACFVPAWWAAGRSVDFLELEIDFVGWMAHLGRWGVKNLVVATVPGALALAVAAPSLVRNVTRRWSNDVVVRFAVMTIVAGELVYLRFPLKPVHLLPVVAAVALLSAGARRTALVLLVAGQLVGGFVTVRLATPDTTDRATGADAAVAVTAGPLLQDLRCRFLDRDDGDWPAWGTDAADARARRNFACQNRAWRGPAAADGASGPVPGAPAARPWTG